MKEKIKSINSRIGFENRERDYDPLRHDLDKGMRFLHFMGMQTKHDVAEVSSGLYALIEELIAKGQLDLRSFEDRKNKTWVQEQDRLKERVHVQVADNLDKYQVQEESSINCMERIPICKARCCKLSFALSFQDLDERIVQWDYSVPYQVKKKENGFCVHHVADTCQCEIYQHRPAVCRTYDCSKDKRIWADFENCVLADDFEKEKS